MNHRISICRAVFTLAWCLVLLIRIAPSRAEGTARIRRAAQTPVETLQLGKAVEKDLNLRESIRFPIALTSGRFYRLTVEQKDIEVVVKLLDSADEMKAFADSPTRYEGTVTLRFIADRDDVGSVEVRAIDDPRGAFRPGKFVVRLAEERAATDADRAFIAKFERAHGLYEESYRLLGTSSEENRAKAKATFEQARELFRELGERLWEAAVLDDYAGLLKVIPIKP